MAASKKMGLSLYADLLDTSKTSAASSTISSAPVKYDVAKRDEEVEAAAAAAKKKDASLQFQPVRRPQAPPKITRPMQKKGPSSHAFSSSTATASLAPTSTSTSSPDKQTPPVTSTPTQQPNLPRSNFEDWVGGEDDDDYYVDSRPKRERGGKNKKKKKGGMQQDTRTWSWDDIYDPTLPNNYADYKGSEEQVMEIRDWKARLYYHRLKEAKKESTARSEEAEARPAMNSMFAPPAALSFAPPSFDDASAKPPVEDDDDDYYPPSVPSRPFGTSDSYDPPISMSIPNDPTGEDAYTRRMHMSGGVQPPPNVPLQAAPATTTPDVSVSPANDKVAVDIAAKKAEAAAKIAAFKAKVEAHKAAKAVIAPVAVVSPTPPATTTIIAPTPPPPTEPEEPGNTISRAPVRYQLPPADMPANDRDDDTPMAGDIAAEDTPRSLRPGQKGFAERLLKKYGWEKGQGLGAEGNEGITTAIVAKAEKRKKLADAQGGGWAAPANMGKLVGGKRRKVGACVEVGEETEAEPYGPLSAVIKLSNMLTGLDIDEEIQNKDLYGEIGREMEGQYGKVERVFIWRREAGGEDDVFVKFVSQLSALRAVGACDGTEFAGNVMGVRFFDGESFEKGEYV